MRLPTLEMEPECTITKTNIYIHVPRKRGCARDSKSTREQRKELRSDVESTEKEQETERLRARDEKCERELWQIRAAHVALVRKRAQV